MNIFDFTKLNKRIFIILACVLVAAIAVVFLGYYLSVSPNGAEETRFVVPQGLDSVNSALQKLEQEHLVRSPGLLRFFLVLRGVVRIDPGGYIIPPHTGAWQLAGILAGEPDMVWVTVVEGWRKEQVAEQLEHQLEWSSDEVVAFLEEPGRQNLPVSDGVYFPDTYLIPVDEGGRETAGRMIAHFNEQFAPYLERALAENIKWDTLLKVASLVQREAGRDDMPIVASVIWNRLEIVMKLDIDATLQYALGTQRARDMLKKEGREVGLPGQAVNWWARPSAADKEIDSPYNTYATPGLPPEPIANPGLPAIEAALNPADTDCLFYLHDTEGEIHCAPTYDEHLDNIERYLR